MAKKELKKEELKKGKKYRMITDSGNQLTVIFRGKEKNEFGETKYITESIYNGDILEVYQAKFRNLKEE